MKRLVPDPQLYRGPAAEAPPPWPVSSLLVLTCTAVSFAHGGNDGRKGMGLIMLILIGVAPTAYALNHDAGRFHAGLYPDGRQGPHRASNNPGPSAIEPQQARLILRRAIADGHVDAPAVRASLEVLSGEIATDIRAFGSIRRVPAAATKNLRNEMYLVSNALRLVTKDRAAAERTYSHAGVATLTSYQHLLERGTRYIPTWVKIVVAPALGLGTMVGWRRIVVTVGGRIGRTHLTYGMGAAAELMAASTILLAELKGLPVSTTHILSSGVAGTMVADGAGVQLGTIRSIALAWVLTLPAAMILSGALYLTLMRLL